MGGYGQFIKAHSQKCLYGFVKIFFLSCFLEVHLAHFFDTWQENSLDLKPLTFSDFYPTHKKDHCSTSVATRAH